MKGKGQNLGIPKNKSVYTPFPFKDDALTPVMQWWLPNVVEYSTPSYYIFCLQIYHLHVYRKACLNLQFRFAFIHSHKTRQTARMTTSLSEYIREHRPARFTTGITKYITRPVFSHLTETNHTSSTIEAFNSIQKVWGYPSRPGKCPILNTIQTAGIRILNPFICPRRRCAYIHAHFWSISPSIRQSYCVVIHSCPISE